MVRPFILSKSASPIFQRTSDTILLPCRNQHVTMVTFMPSGIIKSLRIEIGAGAKIMRVKIHGSIFTVNGSKF